ncbi:Rieske 2Fe-2S domain-containing protein [Flavisolibacter sp. BT320]|nr:Rieske 2Fe-2S domain-containing protein [Flavisolibacter longurius]
MKSRASLKSHPIHPMLIGFPISFFMGAFVFDFLSLVLDQEALATTGYYMVLAGIIVAVLAAVPGIIDFLYTVPPESSAKKRAAKHGLLNVINLLLFVTIFFLRKNDSISPAMIVVLEGIGVGILSTAGWLGGTLVYRNQIGVDPRYADAGKWKEEYLEVGNAPLQVATKDELKVDQMKLVHVNKERIVIARTEKGYVAFSDHCTHRGGSLAGGAMMCGTVYCPWHGSQFDVYDGSVKVGPAKEGIKIYPIEEKENAVYLHITLNKE